ncbi:type I restriction enzyme S subunit [Mucilaginibacter oryzae]|uniref:Type I restriction enzyme S subunit n=1 Tax=Mucilaginibacter oryzae TaxID=468058 RepID=A0A316HEJ9_9SPHI|nr:restriction endonuclease subunit S [Mucilaginibacter oryzae]PWK78451.1 type I restriction enzyme S subunit [Mucilaginibacter oryzae]
MEATTTKTGFEKYPAYKDSGVEWLGEVPEHWEVVKLKRLFHEVKKRTNVELNCGSISFGKVIFKDDEKIPEATKKSYQVVLKGDFLVNPLNLNYDLISLRIALSEIDVVVSSGYIVLHNSVSLDKNYFKWLLHRFDVAYMKVLGSGVRQTLNFNDIGNSDIVLPLIAEQTAIANFLDRKIELIDQAIAQKEKQIELLKERRQVLINKAVTRGLDPDVPLKDSGVEWIGEIPEHWEVKRLKYITTKIGSGVTPSGGGTSYLDSGIPLLRSQNILFGKIDLEGVAFISDKTHNSMNNSKVYKGDVLLNITGGSIGRCHFVELDLPLNVNQHVCIVRPSEDVLTVFLNGLLASNVGQGQIWFNQQGGGREGLNFQSLKNFSLPLPPIAEQAKISLYIEDFSKRTYDAISSKQNEIEKLKEYKATLINSAVTGKIKVN